MIWIPLLLVAVGLFLSGFFSGLETGFYRVTRIRLVLDALGGDPIARGLLWLTNHASIFVATTLVGNNLANYLTSLAIVMGVQSIVYGEGPGHGHVAELIAPLALAPLLFVYGELLPKNLFLHAPNRLLRKGGPLFLLFVPLFFPVSIFLWGLNRILASFAAEAPEEVRLRIARRELRRALEEGHEVGILHPSQVELKKGRRDRWRFACNTVILDDPGHYTDDKGEDDPAQDRARNPSRQENRRDPQTEKREQGEAPSACRAE